MSRSTIRSRDPSACQQRSGFPASHDAELDCSDPLQLAAADARHLCRRDAHVREREVLHLICAGYSHKEIAHLRALAEGTVKNHVFNLLLKLDARDRTRAALKAFQQGRLGQVTSASFPLPVVRIAPSWAVCFRRSRTAFGWQRRGALPTVRFPTDERPLRQGLPFEGEGAKAVFRDSCRSTATNRHCREPDNASRPSSRHEASRASSNLLIQESATDPPLSPRD